MAIPTVYRSDDASAPTISGTAGTLVTALTAILTAGYGSKASAGWTLSYTGTNKAVYRQGGGLQHYLRVDDADARLSRVVTYGSISDIDAVTSSNPFPTAAQISGGLYCRKSVTADSTARPWICLATDTTFYLIIFGNRPSPLSTASFDGGDAHIGFGKLLNTRVAGDINASFLCAASDTSATSTTATDLRQCLVSHGTAAQATLYLNGSYNQGSSASTNCYKRGQTIYGFTQSGAAGNNFPDQVRGALMLYPFTAIEPTGIVRGELPGIRCLGHSVFGAGMPRTLQIVEGKGAYTGRNFMLIGTAVQWGLAFEITGGW